MSNLIELPQGVGWVERSEPHHSSEEILRWGSLRSAHPTISAKRKGR